MSSYWQPDSLRRPSMLTEIKGGHHTQARAHTHTYTHTHTHTHTHQTYSAPPDEQLGSLRCTSISSATVVFPSSLPIRGFYSSLDGSILPSLWQHRGGCYWLRLRGVFKDTVPSLACSNATPLRGQRRAALTCTYISICCTMHSWVWIAQYLLKCVSILSVVWWIFQRVFKHGAIERNNK